MSVVESGDLIFVTGNPWKFQEAREIADLAGVKLVRRAEESTEIQEEDLHELVRHKARDAYRSLMRPLFVEHTSLHIAFIGDFPGGFTKSFLQRFGNDTICELFGTPGRDQASGKT